MPQTTVYLGDQLHDKLRRIAEEERVSTGRVIVHILEKHFGGVKNAGRKAKDNRNNA